ncbi:hypothetical protein [Burkholderia glumae]|uniref:hypothetical protein n=1 Tax=Burkholderia glumae TaxID=337 RepID=UPI0014645F14|nr:hypothetical protein [Burkholderia glumae]QJP72085.1 hypothetical protein HJC54_18185 [Burkholderia glumae]
MTTTMQYQYASCPSGFAWNGQSSYSTQARDVVTYYSGGVQVGQSTTAWYDIDADCSTTEYQQIPCPTGYTGVYYQSRSVTTGNSGYEYGLWTTYGNSCVYNPPPPTAQAECRGPLDTRSFVMTKDRTGYYWDLKEMGITNDPPNKTGVINGGYRYFSGDGGGALGQICRVPV